MIYSGNYSAINFEEEDGKKLFDALYRPSEEYRSGPDIEYKQAFKLYYGFIDMANRDPYRIHPFFNRVFSTIEMLHATFVSMLLSESPRFPIMTEHDIYQPNAEALSLLMDYYADESDFYLTMSRVFKLELLTGKGIVWPQWTEWDEGVEQEEAVKANGFNIGKKKSIVNRQRFGLKWTHVAPWTVGIDPYATRIEDARWVYVKRPVSKSALTKHMQKFFYDADTDVLQKATSAYTDVGKEIRNELGYGFGDNDNDMCMMIFLWCPQVKRYIELLDGETVLRDDLKSDGKTYERCPLVEFNDILAPYPTDFYNIGEVKHVAQMQHLINDNLGQLMNAQQQQIEGLWLWKAGNGFTDDDLIATGGNRIEVTGSEDLDKVLRQIESNPLPGDAYKMLEMMNSMYDETSGMSDYMLGNAPDRTERAYTVNILKEQSDKRTGVKITNNAVAMKKLGKRSLEIIGTELRRMPEEMRRSELQRILGRKADLLIHMSLDEMPGKNDFKIKGADVMAEQERAFNETATLYKLTEGRIDNPNAAAKLLWKKSGRLKADEIEDVFTAPVAPQGAPGMAEQPGQPPAQIVPSGPVMPQAQPQPMAAGQ